MGNTQKLLTEYRRDHLYFELELDNFFSRQPIFMISLRFVPMRKFPEIRGDTNSCFLIIACLASI